MLFKIEFNINLGDRITNGLDVTHSPSKCLLLDAPEAGAVVGN